MNKEELKKARIAEFKEYLGREFNKTTIKNYKEDENLVVPQEIEEAYIYAYIDGFKDSGEYNQEDGDSENVVWSHCQKIDLEKMAKQSLEYYLKETER